MASLALIDYGSGNVHSAARALSEAARTSERAVSLTLTADPDVIAKADRIVLPGVGHFGDCRRAVDERTGLLEAMEEAVHRRGVPFLGICVGMQLLADFGLEDGEHRGFGWIHGQVEPMRAAPSVRIPHMGWNTLELQRPHTVMDGLSRDAHAYFVHSFVFSPEDESVIIAASEHGYPFAAAITKDTVFGTQFHPEKSQAVGLKILANFLSWAP
ncbi:MAG: imidazole glycerol phosphate synthase subunit HisH [Pseudomonadota bacterium]